MSKVIPPPPIDSSDSSVYGALVERQKEVQPVLSQEVVNSIILNGDLSKLTETQLAAYYVHRCRMIGLDPSTKPFDLLKLQGKLTLYANKSCAANLRALNKISTMILEEREWNDLLLIRVRAWYPDGRQHEDEGFASLTGLGGDALGNARLKALTKGTRRAILHLCGLGELDESEVESIPGAKKQSAIQEAKVLIQNVPVTGSDVICIEDIRVIPNGAEVLDKNGGVWPVYDPEVITILMSAGGTDVMVDYQIEDGKYVIKAASV